MKRWILVFVTLPVFLLATANSGGFATGDYVFVKAEIPECTSQMRFVEVGQVLDSGQVTLFEDIVLEAKGKTTSEVAGQLLDSIEKRTGHRSNAIEIVKVAADDQLTMYKFRRQIHTGRSQGCMFQIARGSPHNKAFKFVPGLRPSTGPKKAAPFWAA